MSDHPTCSICLEETLPTGQSLVKCGTCQKFLHVSCAVTMHSSECPNCRAHMFPEIPNNEVRIEEAAQEGRMEVADFVWWVLFGFVFWMDLMNIWVDHVLPWAWKRDSITDTTAEVHSTWVFRFMIVFGFLSGLMVLSWCWSFLMGFSSLPTATNSAPSDGMDPVQDVEEGQNLIAQPKKQPKFERTTYLDKYHLLPDEPHLLYSFLVVLGVAVMLCWYWIWSLHLSSPTKIHN